MENQTDINEIARKAANGRTLEDLQRSMSASVTAKTAHQPNIEAIREYSNTVFAERRTRAKFEGHNEQEMDAQEAVEQFRELVKERAVQLAVFKNNPNFKILFSPEQGVIIRDLILWFINCGESRYRLDKGPYLYGSFGTFKTELMLLFQKFAEHNRLRKRFEFVNIEGQYTKAVAESDFDMVMPNTYLNRCFDEFGRRILVLNRYGNQVLVNDAIIEARYQRFKQYGQISMFISNFEPNHAKTVLSPVAFDRLLEMAQSISWPGESMRKL